MEIFAEQLIYARVEPALSPRRTAGFQTVYHTPSLAASAVSEIQKLVGNFSYARSSNDSAGIPQRLQFFLLPDGRAVMTRSVPAAHKHYIDCNNRPGAFICHCLIMKPDQFRTIGNNPFVVFEGWNGFVSDPEELYRRFVSVTPGDGPLSIARGNSPKSLGWPNEEFDRLRKSAFHAKSMLSKGHSIAFIGPHAATAEVLRAVFNALEPEVRSHCTFTTHADGCQIPPGRFWALGFSRRQRESFAEVDVNARRSVRLPGGESGAGQSSHSRWLDHALATRPTDNVLAVSDAMQLLCNALDDNQTLDGVDESRYVEGVADFRELFSRELLMRLANRVRAFVSDPLAAQVAAWAFEPLKDDELLRITLTSGGLTLQEVAEWSYGFAEDRLLGRLSGDFTRRDWSTLRTLARRARHGRLLFLATSADPLPLLGWKREGDRQRALALLDHDERNDLLATFGHVLALTDFLCPAATQQLLDYASAQELSDQSLYALMKGVIKQGTPFATPLRLIERIEKLPSRWTYKLLRISELREPVDEQLHAALARRAMEDKSPTSWWETLGWPFRLI